MPAPRAAPPHKNFVATPSTAGGYLPTFVLHFADTWLGYLFAATFPAWTYAVLSLPLFSRPLPAIVVMLLLLVRTSLLTRINA